MHFLSEYYKGDPDIRVELGGGYLSDPPYITKGDLHRSVFIVYKGKVIYVFDATPLRPDPRTPQYFGERVSSLINQSRNLIKKKEKHEKVKRASLTPKTASETLVEKRKKIFNDVRSLKLRNIPHSEPLPRMMRLTRVGAEVLSDQMKINEANQELAQVFPESPPTCDTKKCILEFIVEKSQGVYAQQEKMLNALEKGMKKNRKREAPLPKGLRKFQDYIFTAQHSLREAQHFIQYDLKSALNDEAFLAEIATAPPPMPGVGGSCATQVKSFLMQQGL